MNNGSNFILGRKFRLGLAWARLGLGLGSALGQKIVVVVYHRPDWIRIS